MIGWIVGLTIVCAVLYRMGGMKYPFKKWMRRILIPIISSLAMIFLLKVQAPWYIHLISLGAMIALLSTYWDLLNGEDNFYLHGAGIALAYLPYVMVGAIPWVAFGLRMAVLALFMGIWSKIFNDVWFEECGRGGSIPLSMVIYLLP